MAMEAISRDSFEFGMPAQSGKNAGNSRKISPLWIWEAEKLMGKR